MKGPELLPRLDSAALHGRGGQLPWHLCIRQQFSRTTSTLSRKGKHTNVGGIMLGEDALDQSITATPAEDGRGGTDDLESGPTAPITQDGRSADPAARILELAAMTADQLVTSAETEAESLVTTARAEADAILGASRNQANQVAAELSRSRREQAAELDRERAAALAGLADERAAIERQIARLRQIQSDYGSELRRHLTAQLALLDATMPKPPAPSVF